MSSAVMVATSQLREQAPVGVHQRENRTADRSRRRLWYVGTIHGGTNGRMTPHVLKPVQRPNVFEIARSPNQHEQSVITAHQTGISLATIHATYATALQLYNWSDLCESRGKSCMTAEPTGRCTGCKQDIYRVYIICSSLIQAIVKRGYRWRFACSGFELRMVRALPTWDPFMLNLKTSVFCTSRVLTGMIFSKKSWGDLSTTWCTSTSDGQPAEHMICLVANMDMERHGRTYSQRCRTCLAPASVPRIRSNKVKDIFPTAVDNSVSLNLTIAALKDGSEDMGLLDMWTTELGYF